MKNLQYVLVTTLILLFSLAASARQVSIYNIADGSIIYTNSNSSNAYVDADPSFILKGRWYQNANWTVSYSSDGFVSFKNAYNSNLCLDFYYSGYQITQRTCNTADRDQQFELLPTDRGAVLIKVKGRNECLYNYAGTSNYFVYTDTCPAKGSTVGSQWLWALIPSLSAAKRLD